MRSRDGHDPTGDSDVSQDPVECGGSEPLTTGGLRGLLDHAIAERTEGAAAAFAEVLAQPSGPDRIAALLGGAGVAGDGEPALLGIAVRTLRAVCDGASVASDPVGHVLVSDLLELAAARLPEPWASRARTARRRASADPAAETVVLGDVRGTEHADEPLRAFGAERSRIGRYCLESRLGAGGMGVVFRARHTDSGHAAAVKVLRLDAVAGERARRFREEARIVAGLDHPAIVRVFDSGVDEGGGIPSPWIATELVDGVAFSTFAQGLRGGAVPPDKAAVAAILSTFATTCEAIAHAHERGVLHRDLKPQNVLVDGGGAPHVVDFGIAKLVDDGGGTAAGNDTHSGLVLGTPGYMAPEVARRGAVAATFASDIWALGAMLFEALTGATPHDLAGLTPEQALRTMADEPGRRIAALWPGVPRDLAAILAVATATEPRRRYPTAADLRADIERFRAGRPVSAREPTLMEDLVRLAQRHRGSAVAATTLFVLLVGGGIATTWLWQRAAFAEAEHQRSAKRARAAAESSFGALVSVTRMAFELSEKTVDSRRIRELVSAPLALLEGVRGADETPATRRGWLEVEAQLRGILGDMLVRSASWDDALPHRERVLEIQREFGANASPPSRDLAEALVKLGDVLRGRKEHDSGRRLYEDAHAIYVARYAADPAMPHAADDLGWSFERMCFMAARLDADFARAVEHAEERIRLARADHARAATQRSRHALAAAIIRGLEYRNRAEGRRTGEIELVREAIAVLDAALREDPGRRTLMLLQVNGWCLLANEAMELGLHDEARRALREATTQSEMLQQLDPDDYFYRVVALSAWADWLTYAETLELDRARGQKGMFDVGRWFDPKKSAAMVRSAAQHLGDSGARVEADELRGRLQSPRSVGR